MKKMNYRPLLLIMAFLLVAACSKTGPQGPAGTTGATGAQGATGPSGPAGQNGSVIFSGNGAPATSLGVNGDFYIDLSSGTLYGPKAASGWGSGFSLVGPSGATGAKGATGATGATGAAGNTMLNGSGAPGASLGKPGDFYLDTSSYLLYGPKMATGWGTAVSLQGPAGTANVEYSGWNTATNIRDTIIDATNQVIATLSAPAITQNDLNDASFMIFINFGDGVFPLPYTSVAGGTSNTISFIPQVGQFIITRITSDNSGSVSLNPVMQYRYVIIPGGQNIGVIQQHIDLRNYQAVKRYFRIPD